MKLHSPAFLVHPSSLIPHPYRFVAILATALLILVVPGARSAEREEIQRAISKGVAHLQRLLGGSGSIGSELNREGYTGLAALTLLECDVEPSNAVIQKAASALRQGSVTLTHTYSIALTIMFLDRLGEEEDELIIEALTTRLLAGQNAFGGWSYQCPASDSTTVRRLTTLAESRKGKGKGKDSEESESRRSTPSFANEILQQVERMRGAATNALYNPAGDNSNTQFATLALWISRRHGLPVDKALRLVEERFRASQNVDGGWCYSSGSRGSTPSMTCAALLGLAVAHGAASTRALRTNPKARATTPGSKPQNKKAAADPIRDPAIYHGLQFLGRWIDSPLGALGKNTLTGLGPPVPGAVPGFNPAAQQKLAMYDYYLMWSLERVCSAFGRKVIGHQDWYEWGSDLLIAAQGPDGSWDQATFYGVNTSFALLFLSRSNLARDLSETLRGRIRDGEARLRSTPVARGSKERTAPSSGNDTPPQPELAPPSPPLGARTPEPTEAANGSTDAQALSRDLLVAPAQRRAALIEKLRDGPGSAYTDALASAIAGLSGSAQVTAQDALAERLARMKPSTLLDKLQDGNAEVRRAAALACAMKGNKELLPEVVKLLTDREARVGRAAHRALQLLTGEDFGPSKEATQAEKVRAAERWKSYWAQRLEPAPDAEKQEANEIAQDQKQLQGDWVLASVESAGQALSKQAVQQLRTRVTFSGNEFSVRSAGGNQSGKFTIAATLRPKEIDLDNGKEISRGIYAIDGDELRICFVPEGPSRPRLFVTKQSSKQILWTLKRHKAK